MINGIYIEDKLGNTYYFNRVSMQESIKLQSKLGKTKDLEPEKQIEATLEVFKDVFAKSNPNYDMETFDDNVIEYNYELIGIENLLKLINMVLEKVFQSKGTNTNKYAFLQEIQE